MPVGLTEFVIHQLHGVKTIRIPIENDRVVMVGVNGLGKTTVVNLLYLALSRQWDRALEYNFASLELVIDGERVKLPRRERNAPVVDSYRFRQIVSSVLPPSVVHKLLEREDEIFQRALESDNPQLHLASVSERLGVPVQYLERVLLELTPRRRPFEEAQLAIAEEFLRTKLGAFQILYLPTYRRIEKDLKLIFPGLEEQVQTFSRRRSMAAREGDRSYIELVEFGMEDVEVTFRRVRQELNESARAELNNLAASYLRDVLRGQGETYESGVFQDLDEPAVVTILNRVEEKTLTEEDKEHLRSVIRKIKQSPASVEKGVDRYIAHFFSKLVAVHRALTEKERAISGFVEVCNRYLTGKKLIYDQKSYQIQIEMEPSGSIRLRDLSSGEKQIVSLFSHLYLQREGDVLLLIDEPELSLSVPWQKMLLPDIVESGRCAFLAAVTHSPFVFDNQLEEFAIDLAICVQTQLKQ